MAGSEPGTDATGPLAGRRIIVTRARAQASALSDALRALGATVIEAPTTRIQALDPALLRTAIDRLGEYGWAVFTSRNAVEVFLAALRAAGRDARALAGVRLAAVGPATTQAIAEEGLTVELTPRRFVAEGVLEAFAERGDVRGTRVLYACAQGARDVLPEGLAALGARVDRVETYRSVPDHEGGARLGAVITAKEADLITFTAGSAVQAYVEAVGEAAARDLPAASIGPVTSDAARAAGIPVVCEAGESTIPGLVRAVTEYYARRAAPGARGL